MSFSAEPYGTFVEDLLANLTGGRSRLRFTFVDDELPFRIAEHERARLDTIRAHGIAGSAFREFLSGQDFQVSRDGTFVWAGETPAFAPPGAVVPDAGTDVWVGFEVLPGDTPPLLNDRNPGSVLRTLAESFAREYAVLSQQLDLVYEAAFVETASGRDLEQVAALVGVERLGATQAVGEVVLRRATPAPADITVVAGTLVSTGAAPYLTVETTATVTLRRGTFSVAAPVRGQLPGPEGAAAARTLTVLHRPLFGVEEVLNPDAMTFGGGAEPDDELSGRVRRALETSGRSTAGAIRGALAGLPGIREQDVLVREDHLSSPGLVEIVVAAELTPDTQVMASRLLEEYRPAGVRLKHDLPAPTTPLTSLPEDTGGGGDGPPGDQVPSAPGDPFTRVTGRAVVTPGDGQLTEERRTRLADAVRAALVQAVAQPGPGDPLVYNRLVAETMAVEGVLDVVLELGFAPAAGEAVLKRFNLRPAEGKRPRLAPEDLVVEVRGDRVVLDVTATVERGEETLALGRDVALAAIRQHIEQTLVHHFLTTPSRLDTADLKGALPANDQYSVEDVSYRVELVDEGLRISRADVALDLDSQQVVWLRSVTVVEPEGTL